MAGTKPGKWPHYAEWARQDAIAATMRIEELSREAQAAIAANDGLLAILACSDIRQQAQKIREQMIRAKSGEYERE